MKVGPYSVLDHVIQRAKNAARYMNHNLKRYDLDAEVMVLCPYNDPVKGHVAGKCGVYEGPEDDVLTRYVECLRGTKADYVVRLTSDCPLIPPWLISKMVSIVNVAGYHYANNVDETCRSHPDGWDCEVLSAQALEWLDKNAVTSEDREHVTLKLRNDCPDWISKGFLGSNLDLSGLKLSVDTGEDLERVRNYYLRLADRRVKSFHNYGKNSVHVV
jgi:spore coat polysaccharide biosynthesis protein SpsF